MKTRGENYQAFLAPDSKAQIQLTVWRSIQAFGATGILASTPDHRQWNWVLFLREKKSANWRNT